MEKEQTRPDLADAGFDSKGSTPRFNHPFIKNEADAIKAILQKRTLNLFSIVYDEKSQRQWERFLDRGRQFDGAMKGIKETLQPKDTGKNTDNKQKGLLYNLAHTAHLLLQSNILEQQEEVIQKQGLILSTEEKTLRRLVGIGEIHVKIAGVSIRDLMNNRKVSPASAYRFFAELYTVMNNPEIEKTKVFEENSSPLTINYPNLTRATIYNAALLALSINTIDEDFFDEMVFNFLQNKIDSSQKNIIATAKRLIQQASDLKDKMFFTVFDPESPDFPSLKGLVEKHLLKEDIEEQALAMIALGIDDNRSAIYAYRKAQGLSGEDNPNSAFYKNLARCIGNVMEYCSSETIPTKDNLFYLINPDVIIDDKERPAFEDLKRMADSIFQKYSKQEYETEPEKIDWKNHVVPTNVDMLFPRGNSQIFIIALTYKNEEGEELSLKLFFDPKRKQFDWYARESPDDPEMQTIRQTMFLAAYSILKDAQKQAGALYQERQSAKSAEMKPSLQPTAPIKIPQTSWAPRQKAIKRRWPESLDQIGKGVDIKFIVPIRETQQKVKKHIAIPDDENALRDMMEGITPTNQNMIIEAIKEFNNRNIGEFKPLKKVQHQGSKSWELKASDFRVLVIEVLSQKGDREEKGTKTFEIYRISHRKDTFRGRKLQ